LNAPVSEAIPIEMPLPFAIIGHRLSLIVHGLF
jgi:hypothetical protein